jgi:hypothetical protein
MSSRLYEPPPASILQALGTLLISSTELEETLRYVIADEFTQHADSARSLIAGMSFNALVEKFGALYQDRFAPPDGPHEIRAFTLRLHDLHLRREALVHSIWLQWDTGETQQTANRPSRPLAHRGDAGVLASPDILGLAAELDLASHRLAEYRSALRGPGVLVGR